MRPYSVELKASIIAMMLPLQHRPLRADPGGRGGLRPGCGTATQRARQR